MLFGGPSRSHTKLLSHAANPLPVQLDGDVYRIFYSGRDARSRSSVGAVDINIMERRIVEIHENPFFEHGPANSFYADGVSIGNCYEANGVRYMLFMGWQNPADAHWRGDIGRVVLTPELTLLADSVEMVRGLDFAGSLSLSYPWVLPRSTQGFDMWFGSTRVWDAGNGEMLHVIEHAYSVDGHVWHRDGHTVPYQLNCAQAFSRPTVVSKKDGGFEMWFSYRSGSGTAYRLGYATSVDGLVWRLELENTGIDVSESGWDSEMIEYPYVFDHQGCKYLLYNGNGYGLTGFGLAVLDEE